MPRAAQFFSDERDALPIASFSSNQAVAALGFDPKRRAKRRPARPKNFRPQNCSAVGTPDFTPSAVARLESPPRAAYSPVMDDTPQRRDDIVAEWTAILDESEAQVAAGQIVDGSAVMLELHESIARLTMQRRTRQAGKAAGSSTAR